MFKWIKKREDELSSQLVKWLDDLADRLRRTQRRTISIGDHIITLENCQIEKVIKFDQDLEHGNFRIDQVYPTDDVPTTKELLEQQIEPGLNFIKDNGFGVALDEKGRLITVYSNEVFGEGEQDV